METSTTATTPTATTASALAVQSMVGGYSKIPVVQDVSVRAQQGQVVSIVGPNGAGKSTFMKLVAGVLRPMSGTVKLAGRDLTNYSADKMARSGLAYVPQESNVFPRLTVKENLEMGGFILSGDITPRISSLYELFSDLRPAAAKKAGTLSGGQRNMLAMARALMLNPQVLLLDEPTAGLSPIYTGVVWQKVREIASTGTTVVVVEQNVDRAIANSDWVYVLVAGRNRVDGPPSLMRSIDLSAIFLGKKGDSATDKVPAADAG